jgi:hypothetical protein
MKQKLELIVKKGRIIALAGLMSLTIGCASSRFYVEPKVGLIAPISAKEQTYNPSTTIGGALGLSGKFGLEASLDSFNSSAEYIKTKSSLSRVNLNFSLSKAIYLTGGVSFLNESSVISIPEFNVYDKVKNNTTGLEFGIGATIFDRINTRISYMLMPGSENIKGMIILTAGYRFSFGSKK